MNQNDPQAPADAESDHRADARGGRRERREKRPPKPLTAESLSEVALAYVGRFATSRGKLARYLARKLRERGWEGEAPADVPALIEKISGYGYVDDAAYAETTARSLVRRGFGKRRIASAIYAAGIGEDDSAPARQIGEDQRISAALRLAERRRWGPYAEEKITDPAKREKMIAVFLRAGHDARLARSILALAPGEDIASLE